MRVKRRKKRTKHGKARAKNSNMFYDYRAARYKSWPASRIFPRVVVRRNSNFARKNISRYGVCVLSLSLSLSFSFVYNFFSFFFFFFFFCSLCRQLAASNSFVVELASAIGLRFIVTRSPVHPSIIIIVSPRYRFRDHKQVGVRRTMPRNNGRDWLILNF